MRRLARHLFTLCSAVSLLLCVAVCVLWVQSYDASDWVQWTRFLYQESRDGLEPGVIPQDHYRTFTLSAGRGRVAIEVSEMTQDASGGDWSGFEHSVDASAPGVGVDPPDRFWLERLGIAIRNFDPGVRILLPYWLIASLLTVLPIAWARMRWRAHRRMRSGLCAGCGYDLRASPERCPECGTLTAA